MKKVAPVRIRGSLNFYFFLRLVISGKDVRRFLLGTRDILKRRFITELILPTSRYPLPCFVFFYSLASGHDPR